MFDVDRNSDRDFSLLAVGLQRLETRCLHQPDHVRSGVHRRKLRMVSGQRVFDFDGLAGFAAYADWNGKGHGLPKEVRGQIADETVSTDDTACPPRSFLQV